MDIQKIEISRLNPARYNPRKNLTPDDAEYKKLKKSIETFGYVEPIIWNKRTGAIVGGHQRFKIIKAMGYSEIDCVVVDLDTQKEKALNIALNKISGEWDPDVLREVLGSLSLDDQLLSGFDMADLEALFEPEQEPEEDNFDLEGTLGSIGKTPITEPGDIWQLGKHRLLCGDATNPAHVTTLMDGAQADLIFTDPPYNVAYTGKTAEALTIKNDAMSEGNFIEFLTSAFKNMFDSAKKGAAFYIFHADLEGFRFRAAVNRSGFTLKQTLIWVKNTITLGRQDYQWKHEPILYGWKEGGTHYFVDERDNQTVIDDDFRPSAMTKPELVDLCKQLYDLQFKGSTVIHEDKPNRNAEHPTMKPVVLCARLIKNSSRDHALILDLFGGSGSTAIACEQLDRTAYMAEIDPVYCDVIVTRWENFTGKKAFRTTSARQATQRPSNKVN